EGAFYTAIDADSEGEEGKFYVWEKETLEQLIPNKEWDAFNAYYKLEEGLWEHNNIILIRSGIAATSQSKKWQEILYKARAQRVHPSLDNKSLTSWNAMLITALVDAHKSIGFYEHKNY